MSLVKNINSSVNFDSIELTHLVYERGDDGLMMSCKVKKNNKIYYTNIAVNFSQFNRIIDNLLQKGIDIYEVVSNKLFNTESIVAEIDLTKHTTETIEIDSYCLLRNVA